MLCYIEHIRYAQCKLREGSHCSRYDTADLCNWVLVSCLSKYIEYCAILRQAQDEPYHTALPARGELVKS